MVTGNGSDAELLALVDRLRATADGLARCATDFPRPLASLVLLEALADAQQRLACVYHELACWHGTVSQGIHYKADRADQSGPHRANAALKAAVCHANAAADSLLEAHTANGTTRWFDTVQTPQQSTPRTSDQNASNASEARRPVAAGVVR